jgi:Abortive infection C-terminus
MFNEDILDKVKRLQNLMIACATGQQAQDHEYQTLRSELASNSITRDRIPAFVKQCSDLAQFWGWIKYEKGRYAERRDLIWAAFSPLRQHLEFGQSSPANETSLIAITTLNAEHVSELWQKALDRREIDPEGAITAARTLLESVCKTILDDLAVDYGANPDLPKLWLIVAEQLNLAPSQHSEVVFKQILGSCQSIVNSLGAIRNKVGDSHGQGRLPVKPKPRHAELAINLAGSMSAFLVSTWKERGKV